MNSKENKVWGSMNNYKDDSSICRAAIHSGVIGNEGGKFEIGLEFGRNNYKGSIQNDIESFDYNSPWDKSFNVIKYEIKCPIQKFGNVDSFLEENNYEFNKKTSFIESDEKSYFEEKNNEELQNRNLTKSSIK